MFNWIDVAVVAIIGQSVFFAWKRGFVGSVISLFGFLASLVVAKLFHVELSIWMYKTFDWFRLMKDSIYKDALSSLKNGSLEGLGDKFGKDSGFTMPDNLAKFFNDMLGGISKASPYQAKAHLVSDFIANGLCFIMIMVGVQIIFGIVAIALNGFAKLPILREVNGVLGIILGAAKGTIMVYIIFAVIAFASPLMKNTDIVTTINSSQLGSVFYNSNLVIYLINQLL